MCVFVQQPPFRADFPPLHLRTGIEEIDKSSEGPIASDTPGKSPKTIAYAGHANESPGSTSDGGSKHEDLQPGLFEKECVVSTTSYNSVNTDIALAPDRGNEEDFIAEDNPFAFTPGQLNKLLNPKSLAAFKALGGLDGLVKGLRTDIHTGLQDDETKLLGQVSFNEATTTGGLLLEHRKDKVYTVDIQAPIGTHFEDRLRIFRDNRLPEKDPISLLMILWGAYRKDKILILLTIAAVISLALGLYDSFGQARKPGSGAPIDWVEGLAILVAVIICTVVTAINDWQMEAQFRRLNKKKEDREVKAVRSGKTVMISVYDITVGDVLHLEPGDAIPADGILISGHGIKCDESSATGESDQMLKTGGAEVWNAMNNGKVNVDHLDPFILSGGKVLEGVGSYLVTSVGVNSSYGKIMMSLCTETQNTPLQIKLGKLADWIGGFGVGSASLLFIVLVIRFLVSLHSNTQTPAERGSTVVDMLIVSVAIIAVAVPEGLPLAVTLALAFATNRMLKENNLVRILRACETMGNATTICSDKTGTLTQNKMTVVKGTWGVASCFQGLHADDTSITDSPDFTPCFARLSPNFRSLARQSIAINSTAFDGWENGHPAFIGSKTEVALLSMAKQYLDMSSVADDRDNAEIVEVIPFDSTRKYMGVVVKLDNGIHRLLVKGASEILLSSASNTIVDVFDDTLTIKELSEIEKVQIVKTIDKYAQRSLRAIGFLYKDFLEWPGVATLSGLEEVVTAHSNGTSPGMTWLGVVGIQDPLRPGVTAAVARCQSAGVVVRMVTGDNMATARAIATDCGIITGNGVCIEGPVFRQLSDQQMDELLPRLQVLARSSPEDKRILVERLKRLGETVAVTGDGTNDGPALKTADVGFSMGIAGTEVAKEASSIILMDDNFSSIIKAIMWGRAINDAVAKFLQFQISVNITAVLLAFISAVSSPDMMSVLTAVQLLWVNLIMDSFAALALATDAPTEEILNRKPTPKSAPLITVNMWKMILGQAFYQLVVTFILHYAGATILGYNTTAHPELKNQLDTIIFNTFVWLQIFNELNCRRLDNKFNVFAGIHRNWFFIGINCIMVGGQIMIIFVGGKAFSVTVINGKQWALCIGCSIFCLPWAVVLRLIPDKHAETVINFCVNIFNIVFGPVLHMFGLLFGSIWKALKPAFIPVKRAAGRLFHGEKDRAVDPSDEEAGPHKREGSV
ncbi:calcium-transporting ATPase-3 [Coleophoma cylindrospora]|uniref:Calcium-transporting ATPase n=1 Tax=Coleophoma cylindrospora TaxID=1849047 RepID=A0A3D8RU32_9HELO|nr:calcium-transporting ATPase-3 [Coleophoma cylindrospora]